MTGRLDALRARRAANPTLSVTEKRWIYRLEREFPGATWELGDTDDPRTAPPGENTAAQADGQVARPPINACVDTVGPPSASTLSGHVDEVPPDTLLLQRGTGAYDFVFVCGTAYDQQALKEWLQQNQQARILTAPTRLRKDGTPFMNPGGIPQAEAMIAAYVDSAEQLDPLPELFGDRAGEVMPERLVSQAFGDKATLVLLGEGGKVKQARQVLSRFPDRVWPELLELGHT